jgi:hemerythrin
MCVLLQNVDRNANGWPAEAGGSRNKYFSPGHTVCPRGIADIQVCHSQRSAASGRSRAVPFVEWTDEFSVGIDEIDHDHQRLLELLNDLYDALEADAGREIVGNVLEGLVFYVSYHFAHEEGLFLRTNYPGYKGHRRQHQALRVTIKEIQEGFQLGETDGLPQQVLEFLKNWLYEHILRSDRAFSAYLSANGSRIQPQACTGCGP